MRDRRRPFPVRVLALACILLITATLGAMPRALEAQTPVPTPTPTPAPGTTFTVTTTADSGTGSLRWAIDSANTSPGYDRIAFSIGSGVQTIAPGSPLPAITDSVDINGRSQPGFIDSPIIELDGSAAGGNGLLVTSGSVRVLGLVINRFINEGIRIEGPSASATIQGNYIGTDVSGTTAMPNGASGVYIRYSNNNTVGGPDAPDENVVSGNAGWGGVTICGNPTFCGGGGATLSGASGNLVQGNKIGTDASGFNALANAGRGVSVDGANTNRVEDNIISANGWNGVNIVDGSVGNQVFANKIGINAGGFGTLGNGGAGVAVAGGSYGNQIGANSRGNVIANSGGAGVIVDGPTTTGNSIIANSIYGNTAGGIVETNGGNTFGVAGGIVAPVITAAASASSPGSASGTACPNCIVDVFSDQGSQGQISHGQTVADGAGNWTVSADVVGPNVTATATNASGNTSPFSAPFALGAFSYLSLTADTGSIPAAGPAVPLTSIPIEVIAAASSVPAAPLSAVDMRSSPLSAVPLSAVPLSAVVLGSAPLSAVPLSAVPVSYPGGWEAILATTSLAGSPVQSVTLGELLTVAPSALNNVKLGEIDFSSTPLRSVGLAAIALAGVPLSAVPLPGGQDWCGLLAGLGYNCAALGINPASSTLLDISLKGVPLSAVPLSAVPLSAVDLKSSPLSAVPLSAVPLSAVPLSAVPLSAVPLSAVPLSAVSLASIPLSAVDIANTPLSAVPLSAVAPPGGGADFCTFFNAGMPVGQKCADLGITNRSTLGQLVAALAGANISLASTPLSAVPLSAVPLSAVPLSAVPLSAVPVAGSPLSAVPLSAVTVPGGDFCVYFDAGTQAKKCADLGITNGSRLGALLLALQTAGISPSSTPLSAVPLSAVAIGQLPLSAVPLSAVAIGSTPLSAVTVPGGDFCAFFDGGAPTTCSALVITNDSTLHDLLQALQAANIDPASTPLSAVPLSAVPLSAVPLSAVVLNNIDLNSVAIAGTPLSAVPLSAVNIANTPLSAVPLSAVPLSAVGNVVDCGLVDCNTATLGQAAAAGAIKPGATLGDLAVYGSTTLAEIVGAMAGVSPGDVEFFLSFFYGDITVGQAQGSLGNLTLGQILLALLIQSDYPWEELPLEELDLPSLLQGPAISYHLSFIYSGGGAGSNPDIAVHLPGLPDVQFDCARFSIPACQAPGFHYVPGSSSVSVVNGNMGYATVIGDPQVDGNTLHFENLDSLAPGDRVTYDFKARPGLRLGTYASTVVASASTGSLTLAGAAPVQVTESFEPNNTPATATTIQKDVLYISHISSADDIDYYKIPAPADPGARISVYLSHQSMDGDLVLGRAGATALRPPTGAALSKPPLDDAPPDALGTPVPPPETLQDVPLSAVPLSAVSANRGDSDETVSALSVDGSGDYTIQVSGYNGSFSDKPYVLRVKVTPPPPVPQCTARSFPHTGQTGPALPGSLSTDVQTLFLVNQKRLGDLYGPDPAATVVSNLRTLSQRTDVKGAVLTVDANSTVAARYGAWDGNPCSPTAANDVVAAINAVVDGYRANGGLPNLQSIVLVGSDEALPMARIPDFTRVANESGYAGDILAASGNNAVFGSLVTSNILSDNPYGDFNPVPWLNRELYVPDVALGRLVETPDQINAQVAQFESAGGALNPSTAMSTGYAFLSDGAQSVANALDTVIAPNATDRSLINDSWTRAELIAHFNNNGNPPGIDSINSHYDHYRALPAASNAANVISDLFTTADIPPDLTGRIIFSMGCHAGLNLADVLVALNDPRALDWPEAYAGKGAAAYAANSGFGYGDTDLVAYSEKLMSLFAQRFDGSMTIGQALTFAKQQYFGDLVQYETYDEKVLTEATFYGLPMFRIGAGGAAAPAAAATPAALTTDPATGLHVESVAVAPTFTTATPTSRGSYYMADGKAEATSGRPIEPVAARDLPPGPNGEVAHGAILTALQSTDIAPFDPVFSQMAFDTSTAEKPVDEIFPDAIQNVTTRETLAGKQQALTLMLGQYIPNPDGTTPGIGRQRLFTSLDAQVFYSSSSDFSPPTIHQTEAAKVGGVVGFTVDVTDNGTVKRVEILYQDGSGPAWKKVDLTKDPGSDRWTGGAAVTGAVAYQAFAVDDGGNVATSTNKGELFPVLTAPPPSGMNVTVGGTTADNGWYHSASVTVSGGAGVAFETSVDGAAFQPYSGPVAVTGDGVHLVDVRGSDGSTGGAVVAIDNTPPSISLTTPPDGAGYTINQVVAADYQCGDAGSGVQSCTGTVAEGSAIDTSLGSKTFTVTATDFAGNTTSVTHTYGVTYNFTGFFSPVANPDIVNVAKAGSSIPIKWRLQDAQGNYIRDLTIVRLTYGAGACTAGPQDPVDETLAAGSSGLTYDLTNEQYVYAWKTAKIWKGMCLTVRLTLNDGSTHLAYFRLS